MFANLIQASWSATEIPPTFHLRRSPPNGFKLFAVHEFFSGSDSFIPLLILAPSFFFFFHPGSIHSFIPGCIGQLDPFISILLIASYVKFKAFFLSSRLNNLKWCKIMSPSLKCIDEQFAALLHLIRSSFRESFLGIFFCRRWDPSYCTGNLCRALIPPRRSWELPPDKIPNEVNSTERYFTRTVEVSGLS